MGESNWNDFFIAAMGAAAALAGLVIVAISINLKRILKFKQLPGRAAEALVMLVVAMVVAGVGLIPRETTVAAGAWMALLGGASVAFSVRSQTVAYRVMKKPPLGWWLVRALITPLTSFPIAVGGVLLLCGIHAGMSWAAFGILASLAAGVYTTWILLVEILR